MYAFLKHCHFKTDLTDASLDVSNPSHNVVVLHQTSAQGHARANQAAASTHTNTNALHSAIAPHQIVAHAHAHASETVAPTHPSETAHAI